MMWRVGMVGILLATLAAVSSREIVTAWIGQSLVCPEEVVPSAAILIENFDPDYLLFERAAALREAGWSARVLVPVQAAGPPAEGPNPVASGIAALMSRLARMGSLDIIPIQNVEPYTLNAAYQIRDILTREHLGSILLVVPGFRSRRSALTYEAVLASAGVRVHCVPVFGERTPENWAATWHGIQAIAEQLIKLQFYRLYVLPRSHSGAFTLSGMSQV